MGSHCHALDDSTGTSTLELFLVISDLLACDEKITAVLKS